MSWTLHISINEVDSPYFTECDRNLGFKVLSRISLLRIQCDRNVKFHVQYTLLTVHEIYAGLVMNRLVVVSPHLPILLFIIFNPHTASDTLLNYHCGGANTVTRVILEPFHE